MRRDFKEIDGHYAIKKRNHATRTHELVRHLVFAVFDQYEFDVDLEVARSKLDDRVRAFMRANGKDLHELLGSRGSHSDDPVHVFRHVLKQMGLKLDRRQVGKKRRLSIISRRRA